MTASGSRSMLPALSPEEASHSRAVAEAIRARIEAADGWIAFDEFMELALYAPGLGYYTAGTRKFGGEGDFVTAPEISDMYAKCMSRQAAQVMEAIGAADRGGWPGSGTRRAANRLRVVVGVCHAARRGASGRCGACRGGRTERRAYFFSPHFFSPPFLDPAR